jgi:hypothetical protein
MRARRGARTHGAAEGDPVPAWRPGGLAIRPALAAAVGDLAEISAVRADRIKRFIAVQLRLGRVTPREQKYQAAWRPGWVAVRPFAGRLRHRAQASAIGLDDPDVVIAEPTAISQDAELARLLAAGARPADAGQRGDEGWRVLADPESNDFCLLRRPLAT